MQTKDLNPDNFTFTVNESIFFFNHLSDTYDTCSTTSVVLAMSSYLLQSTRQLFLPLIVITKIQMWDTKVTLISIINDLTNTSKAVEFIRRVKSTSFIICNQCISTLIKDLTDTPKALEFMGCIKPNLLLQVINVFQYYFSFLFLNLCVENHRTTFSRPCLNYLIFSTKSSRINSMDM